MNSLTQRIAFALCALMCSTSALAVPACTMASGGNLSFGAVAALASSPNVTTNSGGTFWINCTEDVLGTPTIYSSSSRILVSGGNSLPFSLSTESPGGLEMRAESPGNALGITKNGTNETVTLYGKIFSSDFSSLPSGVYTTVLTITVEY